VQARCGAGELRRRVTLAADGSFSVTATVRDRAREDRRARRIARMVVAGRVAGTAGTGTASARLTFRRGGRVVGRCASGSRLWQVRAPVPEPVAGAAPRANAAYYGVTSQAGAFALQVGGAGRRVRIAVFDYRLTCRRASFETSNLTPGGPIAADGTFRLRERFTLRFADATERFRVRVDGRFTPNGANGTLSVNSVARSLAGRVIDRCRTGRVTFAAAL